MRTLLMLTALLSGPAYACSRVPGTMASGLIRLPAGVSSDCGVKYQQFARSFVQPGEWAELFTLDSSRLAAVLNATVIRMNAAGYALQTNEDIPGSNGRARQLGFLNRAQVKVVFFQYTLAPGTVTFGVTGKSF